MSRVIDQSADLDLPVFTSFVLVVRLLRNFGISSTSKLTNDAYLNFRTRLYVKS